MEKKDKMIMTQDAATSIVAEDTLFNHIANLIDESRNQGHHQDAKFDRVTQYYYTLHNRWPG